MGCIHNWFKPLYYVCKEFDELQRFATFSRVNILREEREARILLEYFWKWNIDFLGSFIQVNRLESSHTLKYPSLPG